MQHHIKKPSKPYRSATVQDWEFGEVTDGHPLFQGHKYSDDAFEQSLCNWDNTTKMPAHFLIQDVASNGMSLSGLPGAILQTSLCFFDTANPSSLASCAASAARYLQGPKPVSWYTTAALSLLLVWIATFSATFVAFVTPTVGIGCHALSYLAFGLFSSLSWATQFLDSRRNWVFWVSLGTKLLTVLAIVGVFMLQVCAFSFPDILSLSLSLSQPVTWNLTTE